MEATRRALRYLKGIISDAIFLHAKNDLRIYGYYDSDWGSRPLSCKSLTGYFVTLGRSPISWRTKKQAIISGSSADVEYQPMTVATSELVWVQTLLVALRVFHTK